MKHFVQMQTRRRLNLACQILYKADVAVLVFLLGLGDLVSKDGLKHELGLAVTVWNRVRSLVRLHRDRMLIVFMCKEFV